MKLVITNVTPIPGPHYTITVQQAYLSFTEDAEFVIMGTSYINWIRTATQSPINLGLNYVAYVDIDSTGTHDLPVSVCAAVDYLDSANRVIIARRIGDSIYVGS